MTEDSDLSQSLNYTIKKGTDLMSTQKILIVQKVEGGSYGWDGEKYKWIQSFQIKEK